MWHLVTLTFRQGHGIYWNVENIHFFNCFFYNISDIIHSRVVILGQKVACQKTFKMMWHSVTLTFGQGHNNYIKISKISFFEKTTHSIHSFNYKTSPKCSLGVDLQNDMTFGDLDRRSRSQPLLESKKMPIFDKLSDTIYWQ